MWASYGVLGINGLIMHDSRYSSWGDVQFPVTAIMYNMIHLHDYTSTGLEINVFAQVPAG